MSAIDALAVVLFLLPIADWVATVLMVKAALEQPRIKAANERAVSAVVLSVAATIAAVFAWARLQGVRIQMDLALIGLAIILVAVSVPALNWLRLYVTGGFRDGHG